MQNHTTNSQKVTNFTRKAVICQTLKRAGFSVMRGIVLYPGGQAFMHDRTIRRTQAVR